MRISDWSSDVCSSDLQGGCVAGQVLEAWRRFTTARCLTVVHIPDSFHSYMAACVIAVNIGDARKRAGDEDKKVRPRGTGFRRFSCLRWSGRIAAGEPCLSQRYAHPRSGIAASTSEEHTSELTPAV